LPSTTLGSLKLSSPSAVKNCDGLPLIT